MILRGIEGVKVKVKLHDNLDPCYNKGSKEEESVPDKYNITSILNL